MRRKISRRDYASFSLDISAIPGAQLTRALGLSDDVVAPSLRNSSLDSGGVQPYNRITAGYAANRPHSRRAVWTHLCPQGEPEVILRFFNSLYSREFYKHAIPILCFHSIVNRQAFERHMSWIRDAGWSVISLPDVVSWMAQRGAPRLPALAITFDDCYMDQFWNAVPVLTKFDFPATFFAVTGWTQGLDGGDGESELPTEPVMTRHELVELQRLGFEIGCHGRTHRALSSLVPAIQKLEIEVAKRELEDILDKEVRFFAYPYGRYTADAAATAKAGGYSAALSVRVGAVRPTDDLFTIKRLCVPAGATQEKLRAQLTWIPQFADAVHAVPRLDRIARTVWTRR